MFTDVRGRSNPGFRKKYSLRQARFARSFFIVVGVLGFVEYAMGRLREEPTKRLQLVMVCRSLDWPTSEGDRLLGLWPSDLKSGKFGLCQLRRRNVAAAATDYQIESDSFLMAIRREGLGLALLTSSVFSAIPSPN